MATAQGADDMKKETGDMNNVLQHIKELEQQLALEKEKTLREQKRNDRLNQKTREGMQSALDSLMTKWVDAVQTKDEVVKTKFKGGLETLVKESAEDNGVWQMMVAASALHERQEHNLDTLRTENTELRARVDGIYADPASRVVGQKSKAGEQMAREDVVTGDDNMWDVFAKDVGSMF